MAEEKFSKDAMEQNQTNPDVDLVATVKEVAKDNDSLETAQQVMFRE